MFLSLSEPTSITNKRPSIYRQFYIYIYISLLIHLIKWAVAWLFSSTPGILKHYTHKHGCGDLFTSQHEGFTQGNVPGLTNVVTKDNICAMLNTLYLHTSQSQSGHLMQYTRSFSLLSINKDPFKHLRYNRLRELHKLLFYFIKDYWFKIKLCHDQSTLSDLHSTILQVYNCSKIYILLK